MSARATCNSSAILTTALLLLGLAGTVEAQFSAEAVKGEFVERFTHFIDWPANSSEMDTTKPFVVAIVGECPYGRFVVNAFRERRARGHRTLVKLLPRGASIPDCQVLIIAKSESARLSTIVRDLKSKPILTVANAKGFARRGVHINLYEHDGFVRFEINLKAVKAAGLHISSKMLKHARIIG